MKKLYFTPERDGFYGAYFENQVKADKAIILMLGDAIDDRMAVSGHGNETSALHRRS